MTRLASRTVRALAHRVRPLSALGASWLVVARVDLGAERHWLAPATGRFHHRAGAPRGGGSQKKTAASGKPSAEAGLATPLGFGHPF